MSDLQLTSINLETGLVEVLSGETKPVEKKKKKQRPLTEAEKQMCTHLRFISYTYRRMGLVIVEGTGEVCCPKCGKKGVLGS